MTALASFAARWRAIVLAGFVLGAVVLALLLPPIAQDLAYHDFADKRRYLGVNNALNVLSNIAFLLAGLHGLAVIKDRVRPPSRRPWLIFFVGVTLVSLGSAWYHWAPDNNSLVWDRLPMAVGFMALFVAIAQDYYNGSRIRQILVPAILTGIASVIYWQQTDDLRFYALVQFLPFGALLLLVVLYSSPYTHTRWLGFALTFYALAKVVEFYDAGVYALSSELFSGHTLKHLFAGGACYCCALFVRNRQLRDNQ